MDVDTKLIVMLKIIIILATVDYIPELGSKSLTYRFASKRLTALMIIIITLVQKCSHY